MAYKAKTYDWNRMIEGIVAVLHDITDNQVPIYSRSRSADHKGYPFIVFDLRQHPDIVQTVEKTHEIFDRVISVQCWAETDGEANAICDDLQTYLYDFKYREKLKSYGIIFEKVVERDHSSDVLAPFLQASYYGFDMVVQLVRNYTSDYPNITKYGGSNNDTND